VPGRWTAQHERTQVAFPEKLLADDEEIVEHLHPHWITLAPAVTSFIVICGLSGLGIAFLPDDKTHHTAHQYLLIAILVAAVILVVWLALAPVIRWRSTHYVITTHRVLIRRGVLKHVGRDITLGRISDVSYEQSIWDRIVRSGSLTIESASEHGQETLINIPRADQIQQTLNRLVEADSVRRSRPFQETPPPGQPPQGQPPQGSGPQASGPQASGPQNPPPYGQPYPTQQYPPGSPQGQPPYGQPYPTQQYPPTPPQ
jgi:membrane protein YdbS with pleckstrin-like domain